MSTSRAGLIGTCVVHGALFGAALWVARGMTEPMQQAVAISLIAAPAPIETAPAKSTVAPVAVKNDKTAPILKPKKTPDKPKPEPKKAPPTEQAPPVVTPPPPPLPDVKPGVGQDPVNIKVEGFQTRYPEYSENIYRQVAQSWYATPRAGRQTTVSFTIQADGSVTGTKTTKGSGDYNFDSDARAVIERIGRDKLFGPLPGGLLTMPVEFLFKPLKP